jgi:tetratricopeptide (TPR) repeat protein
VVRGNQVNMGLPNPGHLDLLYRQSMVPLREILSMETNPHVSDPDRVGIFYAQAWALTHLLMFGGNAESLGKYIGMVEDGGDPGQAFVSVFGPLEEMEKELERYVRQTRMPALKMKAPEKIDAAAFAVAALSEADSAAARGNFLVSGARPDAALPHLERALALAPANALALESMGFYYYRKQQHDQAREWFSKAANVNSESFLCHYYLARLLMDGGGEGDEQAKESLRRAISLNPSFAPAYADLGRLYVSTGVRLESAYGLAAKAAKLAPDNAFNWLNVGQILLKMGKLVEARAAVERASRVARTDALQSMVERFREEIEFHAKRDEEAAVEAANPTPAPPTERSDAPPIEDRFGRLREGDRRIEGRFTELRCERLGTFSFVVVSEGRTRVFHTETPKEIQLIERGESVIRDLRCGPQNVRVAVIYTPSGNEAQGDGELRVLEFLR